MRDTIRYVVLYEGNKVDTIGRIISDESGLRGEVFHEGKWIEWSGVLDVIFDPGFGDVVSFEEANAFAASMGITLYGSLPKMTP
jgi:hypothetical protein